MILLTQKIAVLVILHPVRKIVDTVTLSRSHQWMPSPGGDAALDVVSCGGAAHHLELNYSLAARRLYSVPPSEVYSSSLSTHANSCLV